MQEALLIREEVSLELGYIRDSFEAFQRTSGLQIALKLLGKLANNFEILIEIQSPLVLGADIRSTFQFRSKHQELTLLVG